MFSIAHLSGSAKLKTKNKEDILKKIYNFINVNIKIIIS